MLPPGGHREPCPCPMLEGPSAPDIGGPLRDICGEKRELWRLWVQTELTEKQGAAALGGPHRLRPGRR